MKKLLTSVCVLALVLVCAFVLPTTAQAATEGDYTYKVANGKATITDYTGDASELTIPSALGGYPVTVVGEQAFAYCYSLTSVIIPDGVTTIGNSAFNCCRKLASVTIPDNVTTIGSYAFNNCESLSSATIGKNVTSIGNFAFASCDRLTSITIPDSVIAIGDNVFEYDLALTSVTLGNGVTTIGAYTFSHCKKLESIILPDSVTTIENRAFENCSGLKSITLSAGLKSFGKQVFLACWNLTGIWVDPGNTEFSSDASGVLFNKNKTKLLQAPSGLSGTYKIPNSVTAIGDSAFESCRALTSVSFPASVTEIGDSAFCYCDKLTSVVLPNSLITIGEYAFDFCSSLTSVVIPKRVATIGEFAFSDCSKLTTVTISDSVTTLPESAFSGCEVKKLIIADGSKTVKAMMVVSRKTLEEVVIPNGVTSIGDYAFQNGRNLVWVDIPESVTTIGKDAFSSCKSLVAVKVPDKVKIINEYTFYNCKNLVLVQLPKGLTTVEDYAFGACDSLTDVYYDGYDYQLAKATFGKGNEDLLYARLYCKSSLSIKTQPKNVVASSGKTAKVTVDATGVELKYTWYYAKKGSSKFSKTSVTTASYSVKMSSSVDGRKVYCVVTDKFGNSVTTDTVTLYKGTPAKITTQPKAATVVSGKTGKLEIKASGSSLKYQWYVKYKGASAFTKVGKSSKTYSFTMASKLDGAQAYCVVKDKYGIEVKSSVVTIKQAAKPKITTQPKNITQVSGKKVSFSVKASGEGLKYQWYYAKKGSSSFKKVSGAKSATYSVKVSSSVNGRKYYCLVTDKYGQTVKSSAATLTMKTVAKITTQPKSVTVKNGKTAKVTVKATGDGLKYTWYYLKPGTTKYVKASATGATFSVKMAAAWKNAKVYCVISDKYGNTVKSSVVTLKMK